LRGRVIVCEQEGATWLEEFRPFRAAHDSQGRMRGELLATWDTEPARLSVTSGRKCDVCRRPLALSARSDRRTCSAPCRQRRHRAALVAVRGPRLVVQLS
jgi:hypothetical protein